MANATSGTIRIGSIANPIRLSYVHLFKPNPTDGKDKYSVCILIDKNNTEAVEAIQAAINTVLLNGSNDLKKTKGGKINFHDGDVDKEFDPEYHGMYYINARNTRKPIVIDKSRMPITDPDVVYSGCYACAAIDFFEYESRSENGSVTGRGITASLKAIQFVCDGERLGGGSVDVGIFEQDGTDPFDF